MYNYTDELGNRLNDLLEKNYDAEKGYKKAAENAKSQNLKNFFERRASERYNFGHEIKAELKDLGQEIDKGGSIQGSAHRTWMDVKSWFSSDNDEAMLEAAITGEKAALSEYDELLSKENEPHVPARIESVLNKHRATIKHELDTIKTLESIQ
ncbi:ferritin-like domain-containing protein [Kordia jejudonensis]|uniref:ferritin-like domain-containing protein n=1 Tax=Kordia jejudonensis TaxID=1348245 RepID=UPI0006296AFE|nr:PA2169 family four-helix-bundle protein [Kordia jejudonensis]